MKNIFLFSLLVFCLSACTATRNNDGKSIFYEEMRKCSHLVDLFDKADYKIIPLGIDSLAIPAVGMKFLAHQNYFLVSDDQYVHSLFLYNSQGQFLYTIGSKGQGPHEYSAIVDFSVYHDTVTIADIGASGNSFLHYRLDGNFLGKVESPDRLVSFARNSKGEYIINSGRNAYQANWQITRYTNDFKVIERHWELDEKENNIPVFEHNFSNSDNGIFFHEAFNNQLFKLVDNQFEASYQLFFDDKNDFSRIRTGNFMAEMDKLYQKGFYLLNGYLENESYIFLSFDCMKNSKTEKQVLGVYNKNLNKGNILEIPLSSIFMGNLKDNALYLMASDDFIETQFPDAKRTESTDIYILKIKL